MAMKQTPYSEKFPVFCTHVQIKCLISNLHENNSTVSLKGRLAAFVTIKDALRKGQRQYHINIKS